VREARKYPSDHDDATRGESDVPNGHRNYRTDPSIPADAAEWGGKVTRYQKGLYFKL